MKIIQQRGFNLLEVVIAIFVFAVGMLALSSLQGALTRSMADAKARTIGATLAEEDIESLRAFKQLVSDGVNFAYNDIADTSTTRTVEGVSYTINRDVTDYYYDVTSDSFCSSGSGCPTGVLVSKFKEVAVTVDWSTGSPGFRAQDSSGNATDIALNSGSVTVTAAIPAMVTSASSRVAGESTSSIATPAVSYTPGQNPDIIAIELGSNKFKESLLPIPDVIRTDELVQTSFDVITYSSTDSGSYFLRREEFTAVSCECELHGRDADNQGRRPVIWAGDEYARGGLVTKPYGVSANNQQSYLCDTCCRDHHDGGYSADDHPDTAVNKYSPFKSSSEYFLFGTFAGDHKHYQDDGATVAGDGDKYLEACRMVRQDGFFRVAQDFRREDQYIMPADFLDDQNEIDLYSNYVTTAAAAFTAATYPDYETDPPCIGGPSPCVAEPDMQPVYTADPNTIATDADGNPTQFPSWTQLPFGADAASTEQLRSRGIYIDYLSSDLRTVITCLNNGGDASSCQTGDVVLDKTGSTNVLELVPFFDVQLTFLNRWNETPNNSPVDTTNEPLADNNTHSRGVITENALGSSTVKAISHRGNLGFTDTQAIDPYYSNYVSEADINVQALDSSGSGGGSPYPTDSGNPLVGGTLTESIAGTPTILITEGGDAICDQTSNNWWCEVPASATSATVTVSDYGKKNFNYYACVSGWTPIAQDTAGQTASTVFSLIGIAAGTYYTINIQSTPCS